MRSAASPARSRSWTRSSSFRKIRQAGKFVRPWTRRRKSRPPSDSAGPDVMANLTTRVGALTLKNPLIAAAAEHLIDEAGVRRAIAAGVGAVVVKSVNERDAAKDQLQRAEYAVLNAQWRPVAWDASAPMSATIACRSGLTPQPFDQWLEQTARLDREAAKADCYAVASLILSDLGEAVRMAKLIEQAGIRALEFNIGTPYASVTTQGNVTTEFDPARVGVIVSAMRQAIRLPLWIKLTGQSERVPELARAAFDAGADSVVMAGRLLGFIPDVETLGPRRQRWARTQALFQVHVILGLGSRCCDRWSCTTQSWSRKSAQGVKWSFCLTAGTMS